MNFVVANSLGKPEFGNELGNVNRTGWNPLYSISIRETKLLSKIPLWCSGHAYDRSANCRTVDYCALNS